MFVILSISDSDKHFSLAIQEYEKRLGKRVKFENLKPSRGVNQNFVIEEETKRIVEVVGKKYNDFQKFLLIKEGILYDTVKFSQDLEGKNTLFIIGGPFGVDVSLMRKKIPGLKEVSFGAITLPHGLAKLVLIEQLYRVTTLWTGKKYHY